MLTSKNYEMFLLSIAVLQSTAGKVFTFLSYSWAQSFKFANNLKEQTRRYDCNLENISKFQHAISLLIKKNVNIPERSRNKNVLYSPVAGVQKYVPSLTESNYEEKGNIMYMNETHN